MTRRIVVLGTVLLAGIAVWVLWRWTHALPADVVLRGPTMGTRYAIVVPGDLAATQRDSLQAAVDQELASVVAALSTYAPASEISRFNRQSGSEWVPSSPMLVEVLARADEVHRASAGAFDISVAPLVALWGFSPDEAPVDIPDTSALAAARKRVDQRCLAYRRQPPAVRKCRPDLMLDVSAIGKGYAVDRLIAVLRRFGQTRGLVEIGGEVRTLGYNRRHEPWRIAVERPDGGVQEPFIRLDLADVAVATSGDYRNRVALGGREFGHIIDPRSGWPVAHRLASVSVVADSATLADAWATALFVLGPEHGYETARREGLAAYFITRSEAGFDTRATPAMARWLSPGTDASDD